MRADAFCHSMVRSLVGALLAVGEGRRPVDWPAALLTLGRRADDVTVAPAHGLTLVEVGYPPDDELAARAEQTRARRDLTREQAQVRERGSAHEAGRVRSARSCPRADSSRVVAATSATSESTTPIQRW